MKIFNIILFLFYTCVVRGYNFNYGADFSDEISRTRTVDISNANGDVVISGGQVKVGGRVVQQYPVDDEDYANGDVVISGGKVSFGHSQEEEHNFFEELLQTYEKWLRKMLG